MFNPQEVYRALYNLLTAVEDIHEGEVGAGPECYTVAGNIDRSLIEQARKVLALRDKTGA